MLTVSILYNKSNNFGISKDIDAIIKSIGGKGYVITRRDPLEPPVPTDLAIHVEIPIYGWMPWAKKNILVVNPEWFQKEAWMPYMDKFDAVIYKDRVAAAAAEKDGVQTVRVVPWGCPVPTEILKTNTSPSTEKADLGFVWFLGGSKNKRAAVLPIVKAWLPEYPPLSIYSTEPLADLSGVPLPSNVQFEVRELNADERSVLGRANRGHICCSRAEGFGYTAAEAEWQGAFTVVNDIPVYRQDYADVSGVYMLPNYCVDGSGATVDLSGAVAMYRNYVKSNVLTIDRRQRARERWETFRKNFAAVVDDVASTIKKNEKITLPPYLSNEECPKISIVTLLYNRRKFFNLALHTILTTDYPADKIEWILVEDSDDPAENASDLVVATSNRGFPGTIVYVPLKKKETIGRKRNIGCEKATSDIILMMDDDDHYPTTSFRRRVSWLLKHPWKPRAVATSTIACYDLVTGISAVNVPPLDLPLSQRISEATLTFYKDFWVEKGFPKDIQIGEGDLFLAGREKSTLEIPPQQIIVAFSHTKNASSRRIPTDTSVKPSCFWNFPKEYLSFIHGLAGVKVVEDTSGSSK
jgi:hypothetical protein